MAPLQRGTHLRAPLPLILAAALLVLGLSAAPARADHAQPPRDISQLDYAPEGHFKAGQAIPSADACDTAAKPLMKGRQFNPSGKWNAFDSNVFEVLCLPFRNAGDQSAEDPMGNGGNPRHGFCAPNPVPRPGPEAPLSAVAGECPNHQLEYIDYYEETMQSVLGDFGVTFRRYEFDNPGSGNTSAGRAINPAAIVPGADHPDETIVIGAHYDQTTEGPASVWDSAEGHAQVIRVAALMADYWRRTGTRPSATVKFIPWDGEESGTLGSLDYAENNIVPGEEGKVRGYWNTDPCAGGYPAFRNGNPGSRIALGIQVARPTEIPEEYDRERVEAFNALAPGIVEEVFSKIDDTVSITGGSAEVFISAAEAQAEGKQADTRPGGPVTIGASRPVLFSSDWANFLEKGVPFFNPGPEVTGPSDEQEPGNPDGLAILHTPNDNFETLNRMTGPDASGTTWSDGWMKGMEMCANLLAWGMLRPDQGGAQRSSKDVVAYYEALPNEAAQFAPVTFDARGTHQLADTGSRAKVAAGDLRYEWDFGDGETGTGQTVKHRYSAVGLFRSKLTVTNVRTGQRDTMAVPITVEPSSLRPPVLETPPAQDPDGTFGLRWSFDGSTTDLLGYSIEQALDLRTLVADDAESGLERWTASEPGNTAIQPWQSSDSGAAKVRGNQRASGQRSFWTGVPATAIDPAQVQSGESVLTLKEAVEVPAGNAVLSYASLFQNEGDDRGLVEVAVDDGRNDFKVVDEIAAVNTAAGSTDEFVCDPSSPTTYTTGLKLRSADLSSYAGKKVRVRFRMVYGPENRALSQPCGWYVDDVAVKAGTFVTVGTTDARTTSFEVQDRSKGTYAFRIRGRYPDGLQTGASDVEVVEVTRASGGTTGVPASGAAGPDCTGVTAIRGVRLTGRGARLRIGFVSSVRGGVDVDVLQQSRGRTVVADRVVARFRDRTRSFTWSGRVRGGRRAAAGTYVVRLRAGRQTLRVPVRRSGGRWRTEQPHAASETCGALRSFALSRPVFGGRTQRSLGITFRLREASAVEVTVLRGSRVVKRFPARTRRAGLVRLTLRSRGLPRGLYRVRVRVGTSVVTLASRRI